MNTYRRWLTPAINALLLVLLISACVHEGYFRRAYNRLFMPAPKPYTFRDNPLFAEELDFDTLYHNEPAIVMLGNSMIRKMQWPELLGRGDMAVRGVNGDLTEGILARTPAVVAMHPKIVFVEGGINDIDQRIPVAVIAGHFDKIVMLLQGAGVRPVLMQVPPVAAFYPQSAAVNDSITALNGRLTAIAAGRRTGMVNLNPEIAPKGVLDEHYCRPDGCHLSAPAYAIWKREIERILRAQGM